MTTAEVGETRFFYLCEFPQGDVNVIADLLVIVYGPPTLIITDGIPTVPSVAEKNDKTNPKISNDRLPLKQGSVRFETLRKRVSDNPQHFIFQHPPQDRRKFWIEHEIIPIFFQAFEEPEVNGLQIQLQRQFCAAILRSS